MRLVPSLLLLCMHAAVFAVDVATPGAETAVPVPVAEAGAGGAQQILSQLPNPLPSGVIQEGDTVRWSAGGTAPSFAFQADTWPDENPRLVVDGGILAVSARLVADDRLAAVVALPGLLAQAQAAGLDLATLTLHEGAMTGFHLRSNEVVVLPEGALKRVDVPGADQAARATLETAVSNLRPAIAHSPVNALGRRTLEYVLDRMAKREVAKAQAEVAPDPDTVAADVDEILPSFARRVVRYGWLDQFFPQDKGAVAAVVAAVRAAEESRPVRLYEGPGGRLAQVRDGFGRDGWILTTSRRSAYTTDHLMPLYHWAMPEELKLVVELPVGAKALDQVLPLRARVFFGHQCLADWTPAGGLVAPRDAWREAIPAAGRRGVEKAAVQDFIPPHLLVSDLNGDARLLVTSYGTVAPPRDGGKSEGERFLGEAVKALPDAAHLDLLGELLFTYVYDSPDPRFPYLLGNRQVKGDIHQTTQQSLASVTGGILRGDCDDLSELYHTIAGRQGRLPHVISLPQHAACAWAEKRDDGRWSVFVLQTGPAMQFDDATLPGALAKAYGHFDAGDTFDPNAVGLSLRFSGENTRSMWSLSWRIFAEPDYARTMIDVQQDWHYQTYRRGINKMQRMITGGHLELLPQVLSATSVEAMRAIAPGGDFDNANFRELSGLSTFTGQKDWAVNYHRTAMALLPAEDESSRLYMTIELVGHLHAAGQDAEALKTAEDVLDLLRRRDIKAKLGQSVVQAGMQLAASLAFKEGVPLALRALSETGVAQGMSGQIARIAGWLDSKEFKPEAWEGAPEFQQFRRLGAEFSGLAIALLREAGPDSLATDPTLQLLARATQEWLTGIAFRVHEDQDEDILTYGVVASYYEAILGAERLSPLVDSATMPAVSKDHDKRIGGLAQLPLDLPWIRVAPGYWRMRLARACEKGVTKIDPAQITALGQRLDQAYAACGHLGIRNAWLDDTWHLATVQVAMITGDEARLRERLKFVKDEDDKRLRDDTAQALGDYARFVPIERWRRVLEIWRQELNYKPKWYWIAWRAALSDAPRHALMTAEMAVESFPDDAAFAEEFKFMKEQLDTKK